MTERSNFRLRLLLGIIVLLISLPQHLSSQDRERIIVGKANPLPKPPHPELRQGFYINADGDSVYRSLYVEGDFTIKGCLKRIRRFGTAVPNEYTDSGLVGLAGVVTAFNREYLTEALIDVSTGGFEQHLREKAVCLSYLGDVTLSEEYRLRIVNFALEAINSENEMTRNAGVGIILNFGQVNDVESLFVESPLGDTKDYSFTAVSSRKMELLPIVLKVAGNAHKNPFARISAAYAVQAISGETKSIEDVSNDLLSQVDTVGLDGDRRKAYWLAMRWILRRSEVPDSSVVDGVITLSFNQNFLLSDQAINILAVFAAKGNLAATNALYDLNRMLSPAER